MLGMFQPADPTESLARARVIVVKAFEIDPELPEAHDILALIDEHFEEKVFGPSNGNDALTRLTEVHIVRQPVTNGVGGGVGGDLSGGVRVAAEDSIIIVNARPRRGAPPQIGRSP
jgi:hypothetical protein